ncbi:GTP-binding nuclear protein Ran-3 [Tanacetum coccineum]
MARKNGEGRNQPLAENVPSPEEFVRFHDKFEYFVEITENYEEAIGCIRRITLHNRSMNELIVVKTRLVDVDHPVFLFIRPSDLYLIGIGFSDGTTYELGQTDSTDVLINLESHLLGYKEGYGDLGGLLKVRIGYVPFVAAIREISIGHGIKAEDAGFGAWKKNITRSIATLAVMLCEGTRFNPLFDVFYGLMGDLSSDGTVQAWMKILINNWAVISNVAINGKVSGDKDKKPPTDEDHDYAYGDTDAGMALDYKDWAIHAIAVNHQTDVRSFFPLIYMQF